MSFAVSTEIVVPQPETLFLFCCKAQPRRACKNLNSWSGAPVEAAAETSDHLTKALKGVVPVN
jgi:hypothetical protein